MIVSVTRGTIVESRHTVAACLADARGVVAFATGDVERPVFLRSTAKPFIAATVVASGAAKRFDFDAKEIAVMCGSHFGQPFHVAAVRGMLAKIGLGVEALRCGANAPSYEPAAAALLAAGEAPSALHNNCSGKHAGVLAMCVHLGLDTETYLAPQHPAERRIIEFCARLSGDDPAAVPVAIDGCGIPVYATSLHRAARSFARFATFEEVADDDAFALETVRVAMQSEPFFVAGTGGFDSALMETTAGRIVAKIGAEGVHGDALLRERLGAALKVLDGARRAVAPAAIALLREVGALAPGEADVLAGFSSPAVRNVAGTIVGRVEAEPDTIPA